MMTALEFIGSDLKRMHAMLNNAIADLSAEQLHTVPGGHPKANTIAWGLWHYARTEDNVVRFVLQNRRPTVWAEGGYAERLGLPPVAQGTGMSTAEATREATRATSVWVKKPMSGQPLAMATE